MGARQEIVQVRLMPERLQSLGISPAQVEAKLREAGRDVPWGRFEHAHWPYTLKLAGAFRDLEAIRDLPVARRGERAIRLAEVAQVSRALEREYSRAAISTAGNEFKPVVTLFLYKLPGRDTLALVEQTERLMAEARHSADWIDGLEYRLASDEAAMIQDQLSQSFNNGWQATLVVFIVLFLLLSWREAMVAALAVPVTFLGTLAILWALGHSFNELVIIGLILALGLLVDDFILMMEGMHEGIFVRGLSFPKAAWRTVRYYALPSFSGSVTTILVFLPLAFIGGVDGKFIRLIPSSPRRPSSARGSRSWRNGSSASHSQHHSDDHRWFDPACFIRSGLDAFVRCRHQRRIGFYPDVCAIYAWYLFIGNAGHRESLT